MERKVKVIPCLDTQNGEVVKGVKFEGVKVVGEIEDLAQKYENAGADEIVVLDITATLEKRQTMDNLVTRLKNAASLPLTIGGGISSMEDVEHLFNAGADKVSLATAAFKDPDLIKELVEEYGSERIVVAIDSQWDESSQSYRVLIQAGKKDTGVTLVDYCRQLEDLGITTVLVTSKDKDGTKSGFDQDMYQNIEEASSLEIIASGGAVDVENSVETANNNSQIAGVLAASIFHNDEIDVADLKDALKKEGLA